MSLFDDERVIEAAGQAFAGQSTRGRGDDPYYVEMVTARIPPALNAALAALPREELIEKAGEALANADTSDPEYCALAEATLVAIGLIPEHVTATEER